MLIWSLIIIGTQLLIMVLIIINVENRFCCLTVLLKSLLFWQRYYNMKVVYEETAYVPVIQKAWKTY